MLFTENQDCLHRVVHERLGELLRVLKVVIGKHQTLNSVDILSAAGTVIAKVKGEALKHVTNNIHSYIQLLYSYKIMLVCAVQCYNLSSLVSDGHLLIICFGCGYCKRTRQRNLTLLVLLQEI